MYLAGGRNLNQTKESLKFIYKKRKGRGYKHHYDHRYGKFKNNNILKTLSKTCQ